MQFPSELLTDLKHYVYIYRDPDTGVVFYVGRGKGNRAFSHLDDASETRKREVIRRLRSRGKAPIIEILRYGLSEQESQLVEAAVIDLLGLTQLTNQTRGKHKGSIGRISAKELIEVGKAKSCSIHHKGILVRLTHHYHGGMSEDELYEATRGVWRVSPRRKKAQYAFAVNRGVVKEVYQIDSWHAAGSTPYKTRIQKDLKVPCRWEFVGHKAPEMMRQKYVGKSVRDYLKRGLQNPIVYVSI